MLKILRIILAVVSLIAITALFVDFTGTAAGVLSFLPAVQLVPALFALNLGAIAFVLVLTLLFGRLYCSIICPLGILQDIVAYARKWVTPKNKRRGGIYRYAKAQTALRLGFLGAFVLAAVLGLTGVLAMSYAGMLEPYSIFGRIASQFITPASHALATQGANVLADHSIYIYAGSPAPSAFSWVLASIAATQLLLVLALAWWRGRIYCNAVCPVGTVLGTVSKYSLFKVSIDESKCISCGKCARFCKSQCIDSKNHAIDYSRCVACMDCIDKCSVDALGFRLATSAGKAPKATDGSRRAFLATAGIVGGTLAVSATNKLTDGGFAPLKPKQSNPDGAAPVPPGAISRKHLAANCTACQLCISACPAGILKPSLSPSGFMQPEMKFAEGYCQTTCTVCSDLCPANAITPIDLAAKSMTKIGTAIVTPSICLSATGAQSCGNCAANCPTDAITMVQHKNGNLRPAVDADACIGCGKCEYICPVGSLESITSNVAAIHVVGLDVHINL